MNLKFNTQASENENAGKFAILKELISLKWKTFWRHLRSNKAKGKLNIWDILAKIDE